MSSAWGPPAHNFVPEYQQSGIPYVTSSATNEVSDSAVRISFPFVTRWVQVFNTDSAGADTLRVGFTQNGVNAVETAKGSRGIKQRCLPKIHDRDAQALLSIIAIAIPTVVARTFVHRTFSWHFESKKMA